MTSESFARELIDRQREYAEVARKTVDDDGERRPLIVMDNPCEGKVLIATLRHIPDAAKGRTYSSRQIIDPQRIEPLNDHQYVVFLGDKNDLIPPLHCTEWKNLSALEAIKYYAAHTQEKDGGKPPKASRLASVIGGFLSDPIDTGYRMTESVRPRSLEAVLVSNPSDGKRIANDSSSKTRIYVIEQSIDVTPLTVVAVETKPQEPGYFCTSEGISEEFKSILKGLVGKKKNSTIEQMIVAAIAAIANSPSVSRMGHPSEFDITTVPFERPDRNESYDRFDAKFLAPLYERAMKLRER